METIWQGDVTNPGRAYNLICLVDQIHKYAVNQHRTFVMEHLEAWHARHERLIFDELPPLEDLGPAISADDDIEDEPIEEPDSEDLDRPHGALEVRSVLAMLACTKAVLGRAETEPKWLRLKEASKQVRARKAQAQKERNQALRKLVRSGDRSKAHGAKRGIDSGAKATKKEPQGGKTQGKKSQELGTKSAKRSFGMRLRSSRRQI